ETVTWGGVTGAQPKYAAATTTTDASGHTSNTMTSTTAATNVKATATVSSTTHTGTPVTATTPVTFTADASKATLTVTVTGSRQPTETDTSHTAATADGADLLTLHFKAVDGNGNPVTSTPVHYTTAVSDVGIGQNTLACKTNTTGECSSTVKTTKAGTYNVGVALVPAGAAQPVSPVKTALVFLAGPPDATKSTVSTDKSAANADKKETITVTLTPRDSHNNVVPLWTFRKDLTIVPSVNATVAGAVTVTTPAQDAAGNVAATLTYVDTSGKLLSKEARAGTTTITIGKAVKQTVDTRFYPQVHVCVSNLSASGYIVPGQTEVQICDGSGHAVPNGSGYTVTLPGMSSAGCTKSGGGVCPPDTAGKKADFTGLTGDDIAQLVFRPAKYDITDTYAGATQKSAGPGGTLVYYAELAPHKPYTQLGGSNGKDIFYTAEAKAFCGNAKTERTLYVKSMFSEAMSAGTPTGGSAQVSGIKSLHIGRISSVVHTG
ncbi:Ig-like domain-containing protein, partial [Salmonella enterica]|nr:Ig-like domain-containing protein [Salmonella enterica]